MIIIDDIDQRTEEWFKNRCGSIGGSGITKAVSTGQGRKDYLYKKAAEILSGVHEETFKSSYMDRGNEFESKAINRYAMQFHVEPKIVGMVKPDIKTTADEYKHYSPDFLINENGFGEVKVRIPSVFIKYADTGNIPTADRRQIQWGFRITKRRYCDYINYCPEIAGAGTMGPMIVKRIYQDEKEIKSLNSGADSFIGEMLALVKRLKEAT